MMARLLLAFVLSVALFAPAHAGPGWGVFQDEVGATAVVTPAQGPCDILAAASTPCVAAHSVTRRMLSTYAGPLFVANNGSTTQNIGTLANGTVDTAALKVFCGGATCTMQAICDHITGYCDGTHNSFLQSTAASQGSIVFPLFSGGQSLPMLIINNQLNTAATQFYRNRTSTVNIPTGTAAITEYMITGPNTVGNLYGGTYGDTNSTVTDGGNGTMFALAFSTGVDSVTRGTGTGPWAGVDFENNDRAFGATTDYQYNHWLTKFTSSSGICCYTVKAGDATNGTLTTTNNNTNLPNTSAYCTPPCQYTANWQGGLSLGEGADGTSTPTTFLEGDVVAAATTDATDNAVQANVVAFYGPQVTDPNPSCNANNLLSQPFNFLLTPWINSDLYNFSGSNAVTASGLNPAVDPFGGGYATTISGNGTTNSQYNAAKQILTITPSTQYSFSAYILKTSGATVFPRFEFYDVTAGVEYPAVVNTNAGTIVKGTWGTGTFTSSVSSSGSWWFVSITMTTGASSTSGEVFLSAPAANSSGVRSDQGAVTFATWYCPNLHTAAPPTLSYTASGPSSGVTGSPSTNFTVTLIGGTFNGGQTVTISDSSGGGTFTPSVGSPGTSTVTVTPASSATGFTFTYNAASNGAHTLTFTNAQSWTNPSPLTYTSSTVNSYTASGPSTGTTGSPSSNFTVALASGTFSGSQTITISDGSSGGTITPSVGSPGTSAVTVTPTASTSSFTFTYTAVANNTYTLTFTNAQSWTNPSPLTYTSSSGGLFSTSIPLGNFTQAAQTNASVVANSDGTTTGITTGGSCYSAAYTFVTLPTSDVYTFTLMAYALANPGAADQNSLSVAVDGFPIPAVGQTTANYWTQFTNNSAPAQSFVFQVAVQSGTHLIAVGACTAQNQALAALASGAQSIHIDRLNIAATGAGIPAEPSPQTRDPYLYPGSSYNIINTAIGSGAVWSLSTDADTVELNSVGGTINTTCFSIPFYQGQSTDPIGSFTMTNQAGEFGWVNGTVPFSPHINPSDTVDPCSDQSIALGDATNKRFFYFGSNPGSITGNPPVVDVGLGGTIDTYSQNNTVDEGHQIYGIIRVQDVLDGVIAHGLVAGLTYIMTASGGPYSTINGLGWPVNNYDYICFVGSPTSCPGPIQPGAFLGLPSTVNCTTLVATVGGQMLCHALQDYGAIHTVQSGSPSSPGVFLYAEAATASGATATTIAQMQAAMATLIPQLRIMRNNTPTNFYAGGLGHYAIGGGTPRQPIRAGLI